MLLIKIMSNPNTSEEAETKNFQFRAVPTELHYKWKIISAFTGKSMEEIGLEGIALHILKLMNERKTELKEAGEQLRGTKDETEKAS